MEKESNSNENKSPTMINHSNVIMNKVKAKEEREENKPMHVELYGKMEMYVISMIIVIVIL